MADFLKSAIQLFVFQISTVSVIKITPLLLNSMLDWFLTRRIFLDCLDQGRLLPLDYFHRPVPAEGLADVGQGVVIGVTNYQVRN